MTVPDILYSDTGLGRMVRQDLFLALGHMQVPNPSTMLAVANLCSRVVLNLRRAGAIPEDWVHTPHRLERLYPVEEPDNEESE